ncbi:MAG TPA: glycosyltransferase [Thermodesulfobacteriota bacterium]
MTPPVDVLIPTFGRPAALAVTLTSLALQRARGFRVVVSDQTEGSPSTAAPEVAAALRVLRLHGHPLEVHRHLPRHGMAEQRQFLLERARAPFAIYLDDDLILEPDVVGRLARALARAGCGFVGMAVIGLSFEPDVRPHEQAIEFWDGPVTPELVLPGTPAWDRHRLHNAANLLHVQRALALTPRRERLYRVAWVGGCVMYDAARLREAGGFGFWPELPAEHCGEDVLAQLRVMARSGGAGLAPSGVYHQELPTTIPDRRVDAPIALGPAGPV